MSALLDAAAAVTVLSPVLEAELASIAQSGAIRHLARRYCRGDLGGFSLIYAATDDVAMQREIAAEAKEGGILVNVADAPELCSFLAPSVVRSGDLRIAISTGGASPRISGPWCSFPPAFTGDWHVAALKQAPSRARSRRTRLLGVLTGQRAPNAAGVLGTPSARTTRVQRPMQSLAARPLNQPLSQTASDAAVANRRRQCRTLAIIWIAVLAAFAAMLVGLRSRQNQIDFSHYYASAMALRAGVDPYTTDLTPYAGKARLDIAHIDHAGYPPTFLLCYELLTFFPAPVAYWIWTGMSVIALGATLCLLLYRLNRADRVMAWALAALALMYPPVWGHFYYAQSQILILVMIVLAARWMDEGNEAAAGMVLAFATLLRVFPGLLAGYLVVRRRWRALGYMALGLAIGIGVTIGLIGAHTTSGFVGRFGYLTEDNWLYRPANIALGSFVSRLFVYGFGFPLSARLDLVRKFALNASRLALVLLTVRVTTPHAGDRDHDRRALSLWIVAMILLSPTAWFHYLVLVLMPLIEVISAAQCERASGRAAATAAASYALAIAGCEFTLIGVAPRASLARHALNETGFASLVIAYLAAWWFVRDGLRPGTDERVQNPG